jgi:hypothetical protein
VSTTPLRRFLVYRSAKSRQHLCVCAARDRRHALSIARQMFPLERTAFAVPEGKPRSNVRENVRCRYCGRPSEDGSGVCARCHQTYEVA